MQNLVWRAITPHDRSALKDLNNDCFPLRYEESFYDSACGPHANTRSIAAFEDNVMVAAIVLRCAPASEFDDSVVSTWGWDDPVSESQFCVIFW
jgi:hypothetical protein